MARSLLILLSGLVAFACVNCRGASPDSSSLPAGGQAPRVANPAFVDRNDYIRRPTKSPLCRIVAERERASWMGFIDRSGKVIVEPLLSHAEDFSEGYALVTVDLEQVAIGQDGTIALHQSPGAQAWQQGKRSLPPKNEKRCFIDTTGKVVSKLFDAANDTDCYVADGVAMVQQTRGDSILYTQALRLHRQIRKLGDSARLS